MSSSGRPDMLPHGLISFGSDENCTLSTCPVEWSILTYRPWLAANVVFLAYYAVIALVHVYLGFRWRTWGFMAGMVMGCFSEIIGYAGRIMMWQNPFTFAGFMIEIVCLTIAPVFFTASIYVTLGKAINYFARDLARFPPWLLYCTFIPMDVICLVLQATGGAMSTNSAGQSGVSISQAGLALQVASLVIFSGVFADYMFRFLRSGRASGMMDWRFKAFFGGLIAATLLILARCSYRIAELKEGYRGKLFEEEVPFIILEGVVVALSALALCWGNPGIMFKQNKSEATSSNKEEVSVSPDRSVV